MAITTQATLTATLAWVQSDTDREGTTITDSGTLTYSKTFEDGNSDSQINRLWHDVRTLPSGGTDSFDLTALTREVFGGNTEVSFSGGSIKAILIENLSSDLASDIRFLASGAAAFTGPFGYNDTEVIIKPLSPFLIANRLDGWDVGLLHKNFSIQDIGGSGVQYEISVIGAV